MRHLQRTPFVCRRCTKLLSGLTWPQTDLQWLIPSTQARFASNVVKSRRGPRVAIVGSGPAGFYAATRLLSKVDDAVIDMYERLPVPFGLVRFGVAPDHPEVKNCQDKFTEVAQSPRFNFIGNVSLGRDIPLRSLAPHYDAILFSYGAAQDKLLGLAGEQNMKNIYSARAFVGWYNSLTDRESSNLMPDLQAGDTAIIIGQGNVALDVARILLTDIHLLKKTDISSQALNTLRRSKIRHVRVVGRRGPLQAAFTIKELRELLTLPNVDFTPIPEILFPDPSEFSTLPRPQRRIVELLHEYSNRPTKPNADTNRKTFTLDFLLTPQVLHYEARQYDRCQGIRFDRMALPPAPEGFSPTARSFLASPPQLFGIQAKVFFRSIGYQSVPLPGLSDINVPFDDAKGTIPNDGAGRVRVAKSGNTPLEMGQPTTPVPGVYCTGWVARGPTGVIATTMQDAFIAADSIIADWKSGKTFLDGSTKDTGEPRYGWDAVQEEAVELKLRPVSWKDWEVIDKIEKKRGQAKGKEREKFTNVTDMLKVLAEDGKS